MVPAPQRGDAAHRFGRLTAMPRAQVETHLAARIGWHRAGMLGANDGILSTARLIVGVATASGDKRAFMVAGLAGLVAGAMSMAAGEYITVSSQADTEGANIAKEKAELATDSQAALQELALRDQGRGLTSDLALRVAQQMTASGALAAHTREEAGITPALAANPTLAGLVSAATFASGAALPLLVAAVTKARFLVGLTLTTLLVRIALGAIRSRIGGAGKLRGAARVTLWGALAMPATALVGWAFGTLA
jgi:VIT1/CCC1 family predicted Fe2+/Mn2+ transporter